MSKIRSIDELAQRAGDLHRQVVAIEAEIDEILNELAMRCAKDDTGLLTIRPDLPPADR